MMNAIATPVVSMCQTRSREVFKGHRGDILKTEQDITIKQGDNVTSQAPARRETLVATDMSLTAEFLNPRVSEEVGLDTSMGEKAIAAGMAAKSKARDAPDLIIASRKCRKIPVWETEGPRGEVGA